MSFNIDREDIKLLSCIDAILGFIFSFRRNHRCTEYIIHYLKTIKE